MPVEHAERDPDNGRRDRRVVLHQDAEIDRRLVEGVSGNDFRDLGGLLGLLTGAGEAVSVMAKS